MSYTSESVLPKGATLAQVQDIVELLGYKKATGGPDVPDLFGSYFWYEEKDYRSYVGVEAGIYRNPNGEITVTTRTRAARSYWDLKQQNKTLKIVRDLIGGKFTTDAGRNRYWRPVEPPPTPLSSGCFLARWRFHNALGKARIYLMSRRLEGSIAKETTSGFDFVDDLNPRLLSNNMLLPYVVAIWEEYFRSTFTAALRYSKQREAALKRARLSYRHLEHIALGIQSIERAVAESFPFQRPSSIANNFRLLDQKLDLKAAIRKPYRRRKISLFDSIEKLIESRNEFVHTGHVDLKFFDDQLESALSDMEVAVNRAYESIAAHYRFIPNHDY